MVELARTRQRTYRGDGPSMGFTALSSGRPGPWPDERLRPGSLNPSCTATQDNAHIMPTSETLHWTPSLAGYNSYPRGSFTGAGTVGFVGYLVGARPC